MSPRVVLLILTWNRRDDVLRCVASLPRLTYGNVTALVIDNASQDDTVAALRARNPELRLLCNPRNLGYAGGNNAGIRWALEQGADYVQLINSDTEVTPELVGELVRVAESDPRIAVVGCRNVLMEDPTRLWGAYSTLTYGPFLVRSDGAGAADGPDWQQLRDVDAVIGNGYLWRRAALERVGLLDETFFGYHEDVEWCTRARRAGWRVVYAGSAAIVHRGGSSSAPGHRRVFPARYFLGRNAVAFVRRYGNAADRARFAALCGGALAARLLRAGAQRLTRGRASTALAQELAYARGLWDALRRRPVPFAALGLTDAALESPSPHGGCPLPPGEGQGVEKR
jgi:GT2 family glycosyltransferase